MTDIPTATNGGLLVYVAVALALVFLAATYRPRTQTDPGASALPDRRTGANRNTTTTKEVAMSNDTERLDAILSAVSELKPWWVCPASSEPYRGFAEKVRPDAIHMSGEPAAWVTWQSAPLGDGTLDCWLRRMVDLDDELHVMEVRDDILLDCDDTRTEIPVGLADDAVALIRAATSIYGAHLKPFTEPLEADGWVDETGKTWPSKAAFHAAAQRD